MFEFIETSDLVGYGRLVYNGQEFILPLEVISEIKRMQVSDNMLRTVGASSKSCGSGGCGGCGCND